MSISPKNVSHSLPYDYDSPSPSRSPSPSPYKIKMAPYSPNPLLPGPVSAPSPRRTARRVSYTLKNRVSQYSLPIGIGLFITSIILYMSYSSGSYLPSLGGSGMLDGRDQQIYNTGGYIKENNGLSFLEEHADELIAEDDAYWDSYQEKQGKGKQTDAERKEAEEMEQRRKDVLKTNKEHSLRALTWWIANGGVLPNDYDVPTETEVHQMGSSGMEKELEAVYNGNKGDEIFQEGWAEFAVDRYRAVVFSKTFCPYSKNAKSILGKYHLSPAPFVIELDKRSDMSKIQLLLQYLTGRRTVPNILFDFESIGGSDEVTLLHGEGGLQRQFQDLGLLPGWTRKKLRVEPPKPKVKAEAEAKDEDEMDDDNVPRDLKEMIEAEEREVKGGVGVEMQGEAEELVDSDGDY